MSDKKHYLCNAFQENYSQKVRRDGRVVDYSGLENRRAERHRGFESLSLRQNKEKLLSFSATFFVLIPIPPHSCRHYKETEAAKQESIFPAKAFLSTNLYHTATYSHNGTTRRRSYCKQVLIMLQSAPVYRTISTKSQCNQHHIAKASKLRHMIECIGT